jgi:hypothetical protein
LRFPAFLYASIVRMVVEEKYFGVLQVIGREARKREVVSRAVLNIEFV